MKLGRIFLIFTLCIMTVIFTGCSGSTTPETEINMETEMVAEAQQKNTAEPETIVDESEVAIDETQNIRDETETAIEEEADTTNEVNNPLDENNILGIWRYEDELSSGVPRSLYLNVTAIDLENMTIEMEYDFQNYTDIEGYDIDYNSKSDGIQTYSLKYYDDTTIGVEFDDENLPIGLYYMLEETELRQGSENGYGFMIPIMSETVWLHHE